ncbi:MAG: NAD(P)H-quinone oxidoreductase [Alphaproteobacteria bacterium]
MSQRDAMLAMEISSHGAPDVLKPCSMPVPVPSQGQMVIRVAYAGVNRPDALQRLGLYHPPPNASPLPGLECSGTVVAMGPGVTRWQIGDKVCALLPGGGYAEYALTHESHALPIPDGISMRDAACLPETCFTVWSNMVMRGGLRAGERVLIHGGSSGIGTTGIQIARALGATVYTTTGTDEKARFCEQLGAERGFNYKTDDFATALRKLGGVNLILDMVGGSYIQQNLNALADDGRLVQIAFLQGAKAEVNFTELMTRRLTMTGSTLRPQSDLAKARIALQLETNLWPLIARGAVKVVLDSEYRLYEAPAAHWRIEAAGHIGKIVLKVEE